MCASKKKKKPIFPIGVFSTKKKNYKNHQHVTNYLTTGGKKKSFFFFYSYNVIFCTRFSILIRSTTSESGGGAMVTDFMIFLVVFLIIRKNRKNVLNNDFQAIWNFRICVFMRIRFIRPLQKYSKIRHNLFIRSYNWVVRKKNIVGNGNV